MKERTFVITNELGLHAKPAAVLAQAAGRFKSSVKIDKDGEEVNGKSLLGLLLLEAARGTKLAVKVDGPDEEAAMAALAEVFTQDPIFLKE